jgi:hypothetical protein
MKKCKQGYYYCYDDKKCKKIPSGYRVGLGGWLRKEKEEEKSEDNGDTESKKNGNGNGGNGNGDSGAVSEGWSEKYKKSIDCKNPKGFSQRAHCQGRKKVNEQNNDIFHQGNSNPQMRNMPMGQRNVDKLANAYARSVRSGLIDGANQMSQVKKPKLMKSDSVRVAEAKEKGDHEVSMAQSQLKKSEENIRKLRKALGTKEKNIPAWVQAKITDTEHNTDAASSYMDEGKRDGKSAKDKDYSLRDWFAGGGWVQAGGKYDGKPCAKQPGQKTKPFCRDADDRAAMSKDEREKRAKKKRKEDPNPNRKGKAKMVREQIDTSGQSFNRVFVKAVKNAGGKPEDVIPSTPKSANSKNESYSNWREELTEIYNEPNAQYKDLKGRNQDTSPAGGLRYTRPSTQPPVKKDPLTGLPLASAGTGPKLKPGSGLGGGVPVYPKGSKQPAPTGAKLPPLRLAHYEPEGEVVEETKKDACYKKVKARYDVWPSAYASGALVKCRKVGAANWGNKTKKEGYEFSNWRDDFVPTEIETTDLITPDPIQVPPSNLQKIEEKCWVGYKQLGMKKKGKKMVPNCVKEGQSNWREELTERYAGQYDKGMPGSKPYGGRETGPVQDPDYLRRRIEDIRKSIPVKTASAKKTTQVAHFEPEGELIEDWQKVNKKDKTDGMSQKAVDAYKRENPGSKLKTAVTEKNPGGKRAKRRKSFCARSNGQRKMHNIDCSKTPDKAICKARKRWRC